MNEGVRSGAPGLRRVSRHQRRRLRRFAWALRRCRGVLGERLGVERGERAAVHAREAYAALLPTLPPISLTRDPMALFTMAGTWILALYDGVLAEDGSAEDVGWVLIACLERVYGAVPRWMLQLAGRLFISAPSRWIIDALGRWSQRRRVPGTFVWRVSHDGDADLAIDYLQCPINTILRENGAGELVPYVCNTDYATFAALGLGFGRTQTLAWACSHCDFRMWRSGEPTPAWPPAFVEQNCGCPGPEAANDRQPRPSQETS